jgi:hypothetical protein
VKDRISYSIFVDDGYPEADEYSNNYVERRYPANDTSEARVSHVSIVPAWFERQRLLVRGYLARVTRAVAPPAPGRR